MIDVFEALRYGGVGVAAVGAGILAVAVLVSTPRLDLLSNRVLLMMIALVTSVLGFVVATVGSAGG